MQRERVPVGRHSTAQAQELDPDAVAAVLREHNAGRAPDARLQDLADQDVERVLPRITPGPAES